MGRVGVQLFLGLLFSFGGSLVLVWALIVIGLNRLVWMVLFGIS